MSRIHEALKKAEQERAANQGGGAQAGLGPTPVAAGEATASGAESPALSGQFGPDALLAQSTQMDWQPEAGTMLFLSGEDGVRGTEEYRTLRSRLYHLREKMALKVLLVTSPLPREGKSFTAVNLAHVLVRQPGRRVLLIDADLREPRLHQMLGTTAGPGLSDYLQGKSDEFSVMQRGSVENLFFIPSGTEIQDPSELVGNGRLRLLRQRVEPLFDWIILDSPPAVPVSDASVLAKACDGVLLVVRADATPSDAARRARMEFPEESLVGVVLNGTYEGAAPYSRYYYEAYQKKVPQAGT